MKKLLLGASILFSAMFCANAQTTFYTQTFSTSIPTGWSNQVSTVDGAWEFGTAFGANMATAVSPQGDDAFVDAWDNDPSDSPGWDTLYTASINCSTYSHVFLSMNYMFWQDDGAETATILVSNDGGVTWNLVANLPNGGGAWVNGAMFNLTQYAGGQANVKVAFTYYNGYASVTNGYVAVGMAIESPSLIAPLDYDLGAVSTTLPVFIQNNTATTIAGGIYNYGGDSIASMNVNYSVDGGAPVVDALSSLMVNGLATYNFIHATPWMPTTDGYHTIRIWADNLNGSNVDQKHSNDTLKKTVLVVDTTKAKQVILEEFMQASCNPCMFAAPNLNATLRTTVAEGICNPIRYHVSWPGTDYINNEIDAIFVANRVSYYGVSGVPDAKMDGSTDIYPGSISVAQIQQEANMASPFQVNIAGATYNEGTHLYSATVNITAYSPYAAGLIAQSVINVDTIKYSFNQSTEDPTADFDTPIGPLAVGTGIPDSMYTFITNFPNVAEDMMPSSSGSTLGAFTSGQTQTLNLSWTKNRPWGQKPATYKYDSTGESLTVFVQSPSAVAQLGIAAKYVYQSATAPITIIAGMQEIANGVKFELYPNPTNGNATVQYSLDDEQNVSVALYNVLGENIYTQNFGKMGNGQHFVTIPSNGLQSGVYFVKFTTDNVTTTKRLVIQK